MSRLEPTPQQGRKAALTFIFITVALDIFALGVIAPVLPRLITGFVGGEVVAAAHMVGIFGTVWAVMQFFCSPILGSLSDRHGRRLVILLSNLGLALDYALMALAPSLSWLFIGRVISGITSASIPTAMAYIADVTPEEKRAGAFGIIGAAFGAGFVLGPALGGIVGAINPRLPFWLSGALSLLNFLYGCFVLPESLGLENRTRFSWRRANPMGALNLIRSNTSLLWLAGVIFLDYLAHQIFPTIYVLYVDNRYGWNDRTVGLSLALVGICSGLVNAVLVKHVVARFGDRNCMLAGILLGTLGLVASGLAPTGRLFWAAVPLVSMWGLAGPTILSLMSRYVSATQQGQLQGATNSLNGIAGILGPSLFTGVYAFAIQPAVAWSSSVHVPGVPFFVAAFTLLIALVMAIFASRFERRKLPA